MADRRYHVAFNFAGRYIEARMRRVHWSMRTEGIKAFSKLIRRCSVDGRKRYENVKCGRKSFLNGATQLRFRLITDKCGQGLRPGIQTSFTLVVFFVLT